MKLLNKLFNLLFTLLLIFSMLGTASAHKAPEKVQIKAYYAPLQYVFNGEYLAPPEGEAGFIFEQRTYVPLRFVSTALNKVVGWQADDYIVTLDQPTPLEAVQLHEYRLNHRQATPNVEDVSNYDWPVSSVTAYRSPATYIVDGKQIDVPQDVSIFIINDRIYVPVRFLAEMLGYEIKWHAEKLTIEAGEPAELEKDQEQTTDEQNENNSGGSSSGGSNTTTPTKQSLEAEYERKARHLETRCTNELGALAFQYLNETSQSERSALRSKGEATFEKCETDFEQIITELTSELTKHSYTTEIIPEMRAEFNRQKQFGEQLLESLLS